VWDATTGPGDLTLKGHTRRGHQRGLQARRQAPATRSRWTVKVWDAHTKAPFSGQRCPRPKDESVVEWSMHPSLRAPCCETTPWRFTHSKVIVTVKIENLHDLHDVERGLLAPEQVRSVEVKNALVDTGATSLSMPKRLIEQLGLRPYRSRRARISAPVRHLADATAPCA